MGLFDVWMTTAVQIVEVEVRGSAGVLVWRASWLDTGDAESVCAELLAEVGLRVLTTWDQEPRYSFAVAGDASVQLPAVAEVPKRAPRRRPRRRQAERCREAALFDLPAT